MKRTSKVGLEGVSPRQLEAAARVLRLLAHPQRLCILGVLARRESAAVHEIVALAGLPQAAVSQHLIRMKGLGIVDSRRAGREMRYRIADGRCLGILDCIRAKGGRT